MDVPPAQFFKGTPMLEVLDFLERLAPLSPPDLVVRDPHPLMTAAARTPPKPKEAPPAKTAKPAAPGSGGFDALDALRKSLGRD
jgi:nitrous oxidase accessory protein